MTMDTWWQRAAVGLCGTMLAATGCTRPNPAFGGTTADATTTEVDGEVDGETESETRATAEGGGATEEGNVDTTAAQPNDTDEPSEDTTTGEEEECLLDPPAEIHISVTGADGTVVEPSRKCDAVILRPNGVFAYDEGGVRHQICPACDCAALEGLTLDFEATLTPPIGLPECGKLVVWEGPALDGEGCRWEGFAILDDLVSEIPTYVAANSRMLPMVPFGPVQIDLHAEAVCEESDSECIERIPGRYALGFTSGPSVAVDDEPDVIVGIGFFAEVHYAVDNRMASVDLACREHVAWTALMDG